MKHSLLVALLLIVQNTVQAQEARLTLPIGHTASLIGYRVTPDEKYLVTASEDATGKIWNYRTGKFMYDLKLHTNTLTGIEMSKDGSFVVLASTDGTYSTWEVATGKLLFHSPPEASIRQLFLLPGDTTLLLVKDYVMVIAALKGDEGEMVFDEITEYYSDDKKKQIAISPDYKTLAIHQKNHSIKIYGLPDGNYLSSIERAYIDSTRYYDLTKVDPDFLLFMSNNEVAGSFEGRMMAGFRTDTTKQTFFYPKTVRRYELNSSLTTLAFKNGRDDSIRLWSIPARKMAATIANEQGLNMIAFSPKTGNLILQKNRTVQEWSVTGLLMNEKKLEEGVAYVSQLNEKETIALAGIDNGLQTIHWKTGRTINEFVGKIAAVKKALISSDGLWLFELKGAYSNYWNIKQMTASRFPESNEEQVRNILPTHEPHKVVLEYPSSFSLFNCTEGKVIYTKEGHGILMLKGDSSFLTIANKQIKQWALATGEVTEAWTVTDNINNPAVSGDASLLAYNTEATNNDSIMVWNMKEHTKVASFYRPSEHRETGFVVIYTPGYTPAFRFSADNKYLFFSSGETGWLSIAKLPYEEYVKYGTETDTIKNELDIVYQEGTLEFFSRYHPVAVMEGQHTVLLSADNEVGNDEIRAYNYEKGTVDFRLSYPSFQRIMYYDSVQKQLFTATKNEWLIWDLNQQTLLKKIPLPNGSDAAAVLAPKRQLLTLSNDRIGIQFFDSTKPTYFFSTLDQNETVAYRSDRFYKATPNAAASLSWNIGQKFYDFDQWDMQFNRPDKLLEVTDAKDAGLSSAYYNAYLKRLKKNGIKENGFHYSTQLPQTSILNSQLNGDIVTDPVFMLSLNILPASKKAALKKVFVLVNDNPVFGKNGYNLPAKAEKQVQLPITLSAGLNNIKVSCMDENGNESIREQLQLVHPVATTGQPQVHFIGIGINQFAQPEYNLNWSVKDIRDLALKLKSRYPAIRIDTLFDANVTKENILALKQQLLQLTEDDKVIVSYSGHGILSKEFDYYLSTYHIAFDKPEDKGLAYDDLESLLDNIRPRQKLMLIDACHSGEVDKEEIAKIEASKPSLDSMGTRSKSSIKVVHKKTLGMANSFELMQGLFVNMGKGTGATIISAAGGMQYAQESGDLKNGVFTYSIIEAFNNNPTLKVSELKKLVGSRVMQLTNGLQKPTSRNSTNNYDWVIW